MCYTCGIGTGVCSGLFLLEGLWTVSRGQIRIKVSHSPLFRGSKPKLLGHFEVIVVVVWSPSLSSTVLKRNDSHLKEKVMVDASDTNVF